MGYSVDFPGANVTLTAPDKIENVNDLRVFGNGKTCTSCWQLTDEEVAEILRTGKIFVTVLAGGTQPPVFAGGENETRGLIADYGVWKR